MTTEPPRPVTFQFQRPGWNFGSSVSKKLKKETFLSQLSSWHFAILHHVITLKKSSQSSIRTQSWALTLLRAWPATTTRATTLSLVLSRKAILTSSWDANFFHRAHWTTKMCTLRAVINEGGHAPVFATKVLNRSETKKWFERGSTYTRPH